MIKKLFCLITMAILILTFGMSAYANSAQTYWAGESTSALISKDEKSPLEAKNEVLTFDLNEFPKSNYKNIDEFLDYSGRVTAQYTIHNPSNEAITSKLAFPFGTLPGYDFSEEFEYSELPNRYDSLYNITVNDVTVEKKLRHTFSYGFGTFDYKEDPKNICDSFKKDEFYSPNMPVKVYVFETNGIPEEFSGEAYASALFSVDADNTRILLADCTNYDHKNYKTTEAGLYVENALSFTMYVIGDDIKELPQWKVYSDVSQEVETDAEVKLLFTDNWTFQEVALMFHGSDSGVSETDWYNAAVDKLNNLNFYTGFLGSDLELMLSGSLMQWFEYEITLKAGETIKNTVTAPIYPTINYNFTPTIYDYTYLISPAKSWASFGKIDVIVNTPYYITECNLGDFKKAENGYTLTIDKLADEELFFSLSTAQKPKIDSSFTLDTLHIMLIAYAALISVVVIIILIILKARKKNRK